MPKLPRNVSQERAIRAFMAAGGEEVKLGKGSHCAVRMPNGALLVLPMRLKTGLLARSDALAWSLSSCYEVHSAGLRS